MLASACAAEVEALHLRRNGVVFFGTLRGFGTNVHLSSAPTAGFVLSATFFCNLTTAIPVTKLHQLSSGEISLEKLSRLMRTSCIWSVGY